MPLIALCLLLALPGYAISRLPTTIDGRILAAVWLVLSVTTFLVYRSDKRRAENREARVPEMTLHLLSLLGGWPGAFLAQRVFRHKTAKASFQLIFWAIVLLHQFVALDSLMDWRLTKAALHAVA